MALDIATTTGFAFGEAGGTPSSGSVRLKRQPEDKETAAFNMAAFLRDRFVLDRPDLLFAESYLNPAGHRSADAILLQIGCYFTASSIARLYGVRFEHAAPATIRKHFIGRANEGDRDSTKRAVIARGIALGHLPRGCTDDNRADAVAAWDFASATYARRQPPALALFGGQA